LLLIWIIVLAGAAFLQSRFKTMARTVLLYRSFILNAE